MRGSLSTCNVSKCKKNTKKRQILDPIILNKINLKKIYYLIAGNIVNVG